MAYQQQSTFQDQTFLQEGFPQKRKRGDPICRGSFGLIYLVVDLDKPDEEKYVEKEIFIEDAKRDKLQNISELNILLRLRHPNIVEFCGFTQKSKTISLFLEYMKLGSLQKYIREEGTLSEKKALMFTKQILQGLQYLHENHPPIIHRDIKGGNILLKDTDTVKLTDFGLSKVIHDGTNARTSNIGTYHWMAPEVVSETQYDFKVDIWSVGCTLVEMLTSLPPCSELTGPYKMMALKSKQKPIYSLPHDVSDELGHILELMFEIIPEKRPSASELLKNDFIAQQC